MAVQFSLGFFCLTRLHHGANVLPVGSSAGVDGSPLATAAHRQWAGRGEAVPQQERRGGADGGEGESQEDAV